MQLEINEDAVDCTDWRLAYHPLCNPDVAAYLKSKTLYVILHSSHLNKNFASSCSTSKIIFILLLAVVVGF